MKFLNVGLIVCASSMCFAGPGQDDQRDEFSRATKTMKTEEYTQVEDFSGYNSYNQPQLLPMSIEEESKILAMLPEEAKEFLKTASNEYKSWYLNAIRDQIYNQQISTNPHPHEYEFWYQSLGQDAKILHSGMDEEGKENFKEQIINEKYPWYYKIQNEQIQLNNDLYYQFLENKHILDGIFSQQIHEGCTKAFFNENNLLSLEPNHMAKLAFFCLCQDQYPLSKTIVDTMKREKLLDKISIDHYGYILPIIEYSRIQKAIEAADILSKSLEIPEMQEHLTRDSLTPKNGEFWLFQSFGNEMIQIAQSSMSNEWWNLQQRYPKELINPYKSVRPEEKKKLE